MDEHVAHMFSEAYRILEPGGRFRVTCPDVDLFQRAYRDENDSFFTCEEGLENRTLANMFVDEFATQLASNRGDMSPLGLSDEELVELLSGDVLDDSYDFITSKCDFEVQRKKPGQHINWWNPSKVERFLKQAGFSLIEKSAYGQSNEPGLWNTDWFDGTWPRISLYMEAQK